MIYEEKGSLTIRDMAFSDAQLIADAEIEQGWHVSAEKYLRRLEDQKNGKAIALVAEYNQSPVGYIHIYPNSPWGPFGGSGYPEIVDFGVLEKYRRKGIGSALMNIAEGIAASFADTVYLGVGLHSGYGNAQRMYVKRGYLPDGSGVWYGDRVCEPYGMCRNDDQLILYLFKKLS